VLLELLAGNYTRGEHSRLIRISYQLSLLLSGSELSEAIEIIRYPAPFSVGLSQTTDDNRLSHAATLAIMRHESAFDTQVDSRAGARGLMQLMPAVGRTVAQSMGREGFHIDDLYDAHINFTLGCRLLSEELQRARWNLPQALAAYNAGSEPAARWAGRLRAEEPPELYLDVAEYYETRSYLERVLGSTEVYRRLYQLP
jgi:soluble lytic murein transglycosylase